MRSRAVQQYVSLITERPLSEVDQRTRWLRDFKKIPSARGIQAPHMDERGALLHVLSMVSRRPADAGKVFERLNSLNLVTHPTYPDLSAAFSSEPNRDARRFTLFILSCMIGLIEAAGGFTFRSFAMREDGEYAWLNFDRRSLTGLCFLFSSNEDHQDVTPEEAAKIYSSVADATATNWFVIGADHLRKLGRQIALDAPREPPGIAQDGESDDSLHRAEA